MYLQSTNYLSYSLAKWSNYSIWDSYYY